MNRSIGYILHFVVALLLLAVVAEAEAQVVVDTGRGDVGQEVRVSLRLPDQGRDTLSSVSLRGRFELSNPTVFFPERFVAPSGGTIVESSLERLTDSTYSFSCTIASATGGLTGGDTLCYLAGEALAGYDSITTIDFSGLSLNDGAKPANVGAIITRSVGTPRPYVRFATLEPGYPNPAQRYNVVSWAFRIDKRSPVIFSIYTLTGQELSVHDMGIVEPGTYREEFVVEFSVPTGVYLIRLSTNSGEATQFMHVIK